MRQILLFMCLSLSVASSVASSAAAQTTGERPPSPPPAAYAPGAPGAPPAPYVSAEPDHPRRVFALTISPIHLLLPIVELTGEIRAHDKVGVAIIAGAGRYSSSAGGISLSAAAYEAGAQVRYYLLGDFRHGMQLGAELLYLRLTDARLSASGEGLAVGPFAGYKYTADVGFTFDAQLGFERVAATATTSAANASESAFIPLLNLNIGWSF